MRFETDSLRPPVPLFKIEGDCVMAGPWNREMKRDLFARTEEVVRDVADMPKEDAGSNFWMTFVEVPEGSWGVGGRTVSIETLSPVFAEDRQQRIKEHLAADTEG